MGRCVKSIRNAVHLQKKTNFWDNLSALHWISSASTCLMKRCVTYQTISFLTISSSLLFLAVACKLPQAPQNGQMHWSGGDFKYSNVVNFSCNKGYTLVGSGVVSCQADGTTTTVPTCQNINECKQAKTPCSINASCKDTDGSYTCTCKTGFIGDGVKCAGELFTYSTLLPRNSQTLAIQKC